MSKENKKITDSTGEAEHSCSFCGKSAKEVGQMIAGPDNVFICDECAWRCRDIFRQMAQKKKRRSDAGKEWKKYKDGEIRKLEYGEDDITCVFCGKSIWDIDMVLGTNDKHMCVDCGEDFINATFSEYEIAIENDRVDEELTERLMYHAQRLAKVVEALQKHQEKSKKSQSKKKEKKDGK